LISKVWEMTWPLGMMSNSSIGARGTARGFPSAVAETAGASSASAARRVGMMRRFMSRLLVGLVLLSVVSVSDELALDPCELARGST
jgi:hypothetical protein